MTAPYELHQGDMFDVLPKMNCSSVHMVFADVPFGFPSTNMSWDVQIELDRFWKLIARINVGAIVMTATQPFTSDFVQSNRKHFRYALVWQKNVATNFFNAKTQPLRNHEDVLVFSASHHVYNPQKTQGKPYAGIKRHERSLQFNTAKRTPRAYGSADGTRYPLTVQRFAGVASSDRLHPTQKPVALLEWLIATYTNAGDTVLDPCFGSATTGVACARLGRRFIGIEKDDDYFRIGKERLEAEHEKLRRGPVQTALAV